MSFLVNLVFILILDNGIMFLYRYKDCMLNVFIKFSLMSLFLAKQNLFLEKYEMYYLKQRHLPSAAGTLHLCSCSNFREMAD